MADDFQTVRDHLRVGADFLGDGLVALDRIEAKLRAAEEALEKAALRNCIRRKGYPDAPTCASPVPGEGLPRDQWCYSCEARAARTALQQEGEK